MFKLILEKELHENIGSTKFAFSFAICAVLILLTFYVGARKYQISLAGHEAAKAENLRQMEGLTDWIRVNRHRIFLPPQPLEVLVSGVSNDIGRTIEVQGRGELSASDSRFNDDPIFAVFRFLDLDFIFQIVLSLFAIVFAYDAVSGEKERGTLRLAFANSVPRDKYILGKLVGSFVALAVPLLVPILVGSLLFPLLGIHLSGGEWLRLALIFAAGLLYFGVFLSLAVLVSALTQRSSSAFLMLLVVWIFSVLIIPRTAVLMAGHSTDVPSVDELASQKTRLRTQLWGEDRKKMASFKPSKSQGEPEKLLDEFSRFMDELADERTKKMQQLSNRLNEERRNRQVEQERLAFGLARISPSAAFSLAASRLASTAIDLKQHFVDEANGYQATYAEFMKAKTGRNLGSGIMIFKSRRGGDETEDQPIDPNELPPFQYQGQLEKEVIGAALFDLGLLAALNLLFFSGAIAAFLRYDVR